MARRLTVAQREDYGARAYDLSLQGYSYRNIGEMLGISHHTAASLVHEETAKRAAERPDRRQHTLDSLRRAIRRVWQELEDRNPSSHATAQLMQALNSLQAQMSKIDGIFAPEKLDVQVTSYVIQEELSVLADGPLEAVYIMVEAASRGEDGRQALEEVVSRYEAGTLERLTAPYDSGTRDPLELESPDDILDGLADEHANEDGE